MDIDKEFAAIFESNWLKHADLRGRDVEVEISKCEVRDSNDGKRILVLHFVGKNKIFSLNKTNGAAIFEGYGPPSRWPGKSIVLFGVEARNPQGQKVPGIRVRVPERAKAPQEIEIDDDEIPF